LNAYAAPPPACATSRGSVRFWNARPDRNRFRSHREARMAGFSFFEGFYNPSGCHSAPGHLSFIESEKAAR